MHTSNSAFQPLEDRAQSQPNHPLVHTEERSTEDRVLYLIHRKAYEVAARMSAGKSVLDWGCNNGYGMEIMRPFAAEVAGIDVAAHALKAAQDRLPEIASNIRFYDGLHSPFPLASFDVVTSFQVIEHVGDYDKYLSTIRDALRPGGIAIFTTPNRLIRLEPGMKPWNPFHVYEFTAEDLRARLALYFSSVEIRGLHSRKEIEAIEVSRCLAQKEAAKRASTFRGRLTLISRRLIRWLAPRTQSTWQRKEASDYSTVDFWYDGVGLEQALDLMAIGKI